jgi:hypothetical protein
MTEMKECPMKGCEIMIPDDRLYCTECWYRASDEERVAWMRRGNRSEGANNEPI